jgi:2-desacetyl-2-hydroxyethyl bacteriochlorophyllide A dehydrogenase
MIVHRATAQSCFLRPAANKYGGVAEKNGAEFLKGIRQCREIKRNASFLCQVAPIGKSKKPKSGINSRFVHLKPANEPPKQDAVNTPIRAVVFSEPNKVTLSTVQRNECGPSEIVIRTHYSIISPGTELRMLAGHYGAAGKFPYVPGYTSVGEIIEVGSEAKGWRVGDLVSARNTRPLANMRTLYGAHSAEQVASTNDTDRPALLPAGAEPLDYILTELAAIPLRGVEAAMPKPGETAIVIGQGLIGSLSAKWLLLSGCRVAVVDMEESRLERARRNGAALAVSAADKNLKERLGVFTNGGADIVVEASGSSPGVELARSLLRRKPQNYSADYTVEPIHFYGGDWPRLIFQANYLEPISWNPDHTAPGEGSIIITPRDRGMEERQRVIEHIRTGRFKSSDFLDAVLPYTEAPEAYAGLKERRLFSAVLDWKGATK